MRLGVGQRANIQIKYSRSTKAQQTKVTEYQVSIWHEIACGGFTGPRNARECERGKIETSMEIDVLWDNQTLRGGKKNEKQEQEDQ